MSDVTVFAPAAKPGREPASPQEWTEYWRARCNDLELERKRDKIALDTFSNVVASFVKVAVEQHGGGPLEVMLPRSVSDRMEGANVTVSEAPGTRDILVRIRERAPRPLWEGRHE